MIISSGDAKEWLRIENADEDGTLEALCTAAEAYLKNATGVEFTSSNSLAKLFCRVLVTDWYENRGFMQEQKVSNKVRYTLQSILLQLQYSDEAQGVSP